MNRIIASLMIVFLFAVGQFSLAIEPYEFPDEDTQKRFQQLTFELRCPKCQNQNIADSNAPIAKDLRREVHRMLVEGKEDDEVVEFMVERYGNFVLYRPPFSAQTMALWTVPIILVVFGVAVAFWLGRVNRSKGRKEDDLSVPEQQQLRQLLQESGASQESTRS